MMGAPGLPRVLRPFADAHHVFLGVFGPMDINNRDCTARRRRFQPNKFLLRFGCFEHRVVRATHLQTAFEQKAEANQMNRHRLNALWRRPPRMLHCVSVHAEPIVWRICRIAIFAREHFAICRPACRRRFHVSMRRPFHFRKKPAAADAGIEIQINPRLRKSPMFPPLERSIMSIVNLSRQTSQASSTP